MGKTEQWEDTSPASVGKLAPLLTSWVLGHAPWPHVALCHPHVKGCHDTLWRTAHICSAPSRLSNLLVRHVQVWGKAVDSASPDLLMSSFPGRNGPPRTRKNWLDGGKHREQVEFCTSGIFWKDVQYVRGLKTIKNMVSWDKLSNPKYHLACEIVLTRHSLLWTECLGPVLLFLQTTSHFLPSLQPPLCTLTCLSWYLDSWGALQLLQMLMAYCGHAALTQPPLFLTSTILLFHSWYKWDAH